MINSINSVGSMNYMPKANMNQKLTENQISQVESILSEFDASSLTTEDALSIADAFKEAGIKPNAELASLMENVGFSAREIGDMISSSKNGGMQPPPRPMSQNGGLNTESLQALFEIMEQYDLSNLSEEDKVSLNRSLTEGGLYNSGVLFNGVA